MTSGDGAGVPPVPANLPAKLPASPPLATLTRGTIVVRFHDRFGLPSPARTEAGTAGHPHAAPNGAPTAAPNGTPRRREFRRLHDAETFLRSWKAAPGAMADLRRALGRCDRSVTLFRHSDDAVLRALATALVTGSVIVTESGWPTLRPGPQSVAAPAAAPEPAAAPGAPAPLAPATPALLVLDPLPEALLPVLQDVQIEGAQVLPEVWQSLEQINLSMEQLNLATVSLAPTPSGVPAISSASTAASDSITATLGAL